MNSTHPKSVIVVTTARLDLISPTQLATPLAKVTFVRRDTTAHLDLLHRLNVLQEPTSAELALTSVKSAQSATTVKPAVSHPLSAKTVSVLRDLAHPPSVALVPTALKLLRS